MSGALIIVEGKDDQRALSSCGLKCPFRFLLKERWAYGIGPDAPDHAGIGEVDTASSSRRINIVPTLSLSPPGEQTIGRCLW